MKKIHCSIIVPVLMLVGALVCVSCKSSELISADSYTVSSPGTEIKRQESGDTPRNIVRPKSGNTFVNFFYRRAAGYRNRYDAGIPKNRLRYAERRRRTVHLQYRNGAFGLCRMVSRRYVSRIAEQNRTRLISGSRQSIPRRF